MTASPLDRFAVLSDIHGNLSALEAVLADIASRSVQPIVNLGDHLQGPLDPVGTADRLIPLNLPSVRGNCDRLLFEAGTIVTSGSTLEGNRAILNGQHKQWLAAMPQTLQLDDILLCHGTPWADDVYLLEEVTPEGSRMKRTGELAPILHGITEGLVLCGHSHLSRAVQLSAQISARCPAVRWWSIPAASASLPIRKNRRIRTRWKPAARTAAMPSSPAQTTTGR